ncbi:MAG: restriction endonuclease subunit S [Methanosarcinales archaeon]
MSSEVAVEMQGGRWKRYPAYKDSGVEWLGEVPEGWGILALRRVVSRFVDYRGKTPEKVDSGVPLITAKNIKGGHIDLSSSEEFIREHEYQDWMTRGLPENGDVLITTEAPLGEVAQVESTYIALAQRIILLKVNKSRITNSYLKYHFLSKSGQGELWTQSSGSTALGIKADRFKGTLISVPSLPEQRAIASFLNRETGCIDTLIEKKGRQIELLQEKRAALISHAVTKGLDPGVKMKDSGVEWIGEVPEGWKVRKLKHIASVKFSSVDKKTEEGQQPVCLCNYVDVYYNDYITSYLDLMKATASVAEIQNFTLRGGDILITKDSESWDDIAVPAYVSSDINNVLCGYHLAQIRPNISLSDGEYLFRSFYARGINDQFRVAATGVTRYGLGKYWLDNSLFLVPPLPEQHAIATFLDRETGRIDTLTTKIRESISKLREYRTALISAAVTGKIDVRNKET